MSKQLHFEYYYSKKTAFYRGIQPIRGKERSNKAIERQQSTIQVQQGTNQVRTRYEPSTNQVRTKYELSTNQVQYKYDPSITRVALKRHNPAKFHKFAKRILGLGSFAHIHNGNGTRAAMAGNRAAAFDNGYFFRIRLLQQRCPDIIRSFLGKRLGHDD